MRALYCGRRGRINSSIEIQRDDAWSLGADTGSLLDGRKKKEESERKIYDKQVPSVRYRIDHTTKKKVKLVWCSGNNIFRLTDFYILVLLDQNNRQRCHCWKISMFLCLKIFYIFSLSLNLMKFLHSLILKRIINYY